MEFKFEKFIIWQNGKDYGLPIRYLSEAVTYYKKAGDKKLRSSDFGLQTD